MPFCAHCGSPVADVSSSCPSCGRQPGIAAGIPPVENMPSVANAPPVQVAPANRASKFALIAIALGVGCLVLIVIGGILAAIAIPNFLTAMQRSRQKRTMADMRSIATATEAYATDKNEYPHASSLDELASALTPTYMREVPRLDGWSHLYRYDCWPRDGRCQSYAIASGGKDGAFEHESLQEYTSGTATEKFDCDIVFSNGSFVQYPAGVQQH
ncbi:MAG TPA: type II secretion system protein GspG [Thermoanaerobaculia bacterium]|jgi:general secretion pathway protein G